MRSTALWWPWGVYTQMNLAGRKPKALGLVYQDLRRDVPSTQKRCTSTCSKTPPGARTQPSSPWEADGLGLRIEDCSLHCLAVFAGDSGLLPLPLEEPKSLSPTAAASRGWGREATPAGEAGPHARTHWVTESSPSTSLEPHVPPWQNWVGPQLYLSPFPDQMIYGSKS